MDSQEKGVPIRVPATANLMVASEDRTNGSVVDFLINKPDSIMNGFFNRIATTEVVLDWRVYNISQTSLGNATFSVVVGGNPYSITLVPGQYSVAYALDEIAAELNNAGTGANWDVVPATGNAASVGIVYLRADQPWTLNLTALAAALGLAPGASTNFGGTNNGIYVIDPDLRAYRYIDFVSESLTYNQDVKDNSTNIRSRNVLCRWYFASDSPPETDPLGFPILPGYVPYIARRIFSPPKQIKWNPAQPIGQMRLQVYADSLPGTALSFAGQMEYYMTLQVSEN